jgi:hypothetical protein
VSRRLVCLVARAPARRLVRRLGRRLMTPMLAVVVVALVKGVAGTVAAAVAGSVALTGGGLWWWARVVEPRLFAPRSPRRSPQLVRPVTPSQPSPSEGERHLMFAQALAYVATRYLAECEQEVGNDREIR